MSPGDALAAFAMSGHARLGVDYLREQERLGCIPPAWRFAARGARVTYWGLPGASEPIMIDAIVDDDGAAAGLLVESLAQLGLGAGAMDYFAARPVGASRDLATEPACLERLGFHLVATQVRLEHTGDVGTASDADPPGLTFTALGDEELDVLRALMRDVSTASLDRATRDQDVDAELAGLCALDREPAWWQLAHDHERPCGFVLPSRTADGGAVISFIGVTPAARGRGLGRALLARATASLRAGASRVVADVDSENAPMLRAAAAVGYVPFATRAHYRRGGAAGA